MKFLNQFVLFAIFLISISLTAAEMGSNSYATEKQNSKEILTQANNLFSHGEFSDAIVLYKSLRKEASIDQAFVLKKLALCSARLKQEAAAVNYLETYLSYEFNPAIAQLDHFDSIKHTPQFESFISKYDLKYDFWSFLYLYVALIGFYIATILNFNKAIDVPAKILISSFLFIHSIFILHICLSITNFQYKFPHTLGMSTGFSFLYGPLIYFYFKRITQEYRFKKSDLLHLLPTILFLIYSLPLYMLSADEKLSLMIERNANGRSFYDVTIIILKLASLVIYGYFLSKLYKVSRHDTVTSKENKNWQKNIFRIHVLYVMCYAAYGLLLGNNITSGFFFHMQIISMALMVMYIGYSANIQPRLFNGLFSIDNRIFYKYEKSGLTPSLSKELKEQLVLLFHTEKIYKESDINLEFVANQLNTTKHNASQVINEHFRLSFHELVNSYRIREAKEILKTNFSKNLNIIDVAFEVGYNNKVTFNKAFKKATDMTPSQYQKTFLSHQMELTR